MYIKLTDIDSGEELEIVQVPNDITPEQLEKVLDGRDISWKRISIIKCDTLNEFIAYLSW